MLAKYQAPTDYYSYFKSLINSKEDNAFLTSLNYFSSKKIEISELADDCENTKETMERYKNLLQLISSFLDIPNAAKTEFILFLDYHEQYHLLMSLISIIEIHSLVKPLLSLYKLNMTKERETPLKINGFIQLLLMKHSASNYDSITREVEVFDIIYNFVHEHTCSFWYDLKSVEKL